MAGLLNGFKVAILITNGFQQIEMTNPRQMLQNMGAIVHIISPDKDKVTGWDCDIPKAMDQFKIDINLADALASNYDALLIPGGYGSPEELRMNKKAINFVREFENKPIAAICHGPNLLIDAKLVKNKKLTSYPAIKEDLINAGAIWIDKEVVIDFNLVTSRTPDDLKAFNKKIIELFSEANKAKQNNGSNKIKDLMVRNYNWFNHIINPNNPLDFSELKNLITQDFSWKSGNETWANDYSSMCEVIKELRNGDYLLHIELPFLEVIVSHDDKNCVLRYIASKKFKNGTIKKEHIIAIFDINLDGKLSRIHEVSKVIS